MMVAKYGNYSPTQIHEAKQSLQKSIFFLLLCADPQTSEQFPDVDVPEAIRNVQYKLNGLNSILLEPPELVTTMCLIESALMEYSGEDFSYPRYRKLILDAGSEIMKVGDADD